MSTSPRENTKYFTSYRVTQYQFFTAFFDAKVIRQKAMLVFSLVVAICIKLYFFPKCFMTLIKPECAKTCINVHLFSNAKKSFIVLHVYLDLESNSVHVQDIFNVKENYGLLIKDNKNRSLLLKYFPSFFV